MTMHEPNALDPDTEFRNLGSLFPTLFGGFEIATETACQFFESQGKTVNSALYPALVRYYMREYLEDRGQAVDDFDREEIFNNGLCITYGTRRIRMWKTIDDSIPPPGQSFTKQSFLSQQLAMPLLDGGPKLVELNLVILWNVDFHHRLRRLYLVCPKTSLQNGAAVEAYWSRSIPHPAESSVSGVGEVQPDESTDLPIQIADDGVDESKRAE